MKSLWEALAGKEAAAAASVLREKNDAFNQAIRAYDEQVRVLNALGDDVKRTKNEVLAAVQLLVVATKNGAKNG